jgi:hypothetical protein
MFRCPVARLLELSMYRCCQSADGDRKPSIRAVFSSPQSGDLQIRPLPSRLDSARYHVHHNVRNVQTSRSGGSSIESIDTLMASLEERASIPVFLQRRFFQISTPLKTNSVALSPRTNYTD